MRDESDFELALQAALDGKTKPAGSLGQLEVLAGQIARTQGTLSPRMEHCRLVIFAGDHGVAEAGVSAFPQAVTRQMVGNFLAGGAAACVFARTLGVDVVVVDAGVAGEPITHPDLRRHSMGPGTANFLHGPAMPLDVAEAAVAVGRSIGAEASGEAAAFGEMGIGNTTSAALVSAKVTGLSSAALVGRGTGLDAEALGRKHAVVEAAASRTPVQLSAMHALSEYGGFEIAMMAGAMIAAAETRKIVIVDGFIATAAAAAALAIAPSIRGALVFGHRSAEQGHGTLLDALGAVPLLELDMRLGEGTGALLAWPLVRAAAAMLREMASFEGAGVSRG